MPLSTGNFLTLLTLSSGANTELFQSDALGRGAVTTNVNGQRPTNNNYQLEGINANDINLPQLDNVPLPNPSTVQEFKTQTSLYDASQGTDLTRVPLTAEFPLEVLESGRYTLKIVITDRTAKKSEAQQVDFTVE